MNYYQAREALDADGKPSGLWRYTVRNDDRIHAVGYCAQGCPGHDSEEGAYAHQREYELDNARFNGEWAGAWYICAAEGCEALTNRFASIGPGLMQTFTLCDDHRNRDGLAAVYTGPGMVMSS